MSTKEEVVLRAARKALSRLYLAPGFVQCTTDGKKRVAPVFSAFANEYEAIKTLHWEDGRIANGVSYDRASIHFHLDSGHEVIMIVTIMHSRLYRDVWTVARIEWEDLVSRITGFFMFNGALPGHMICKCGHDWAPEEELPIPQILPRQSGCRYCHDSENVSSIPKTVQGSELYPHLVV